MFATLRDLLFISKLGRLPLVAILLALSSCAKFSYILDQGRGQWRLLKEARLNQEILNDPTVPKTAKEKLKLAMSYRDYFYRYWKKNPTDVYSKTTMLEQEAVTYLVIASPWSKIEAHQECFPVMGCFPYLGFFDKDKARAHQAALESQELVTFVRPVYAYSSLGHFDDPILSSFFQFDEVELARLVFHELFHTIFFIKNEVNLNEALANYVADRMLLDYFSTRHDLLQTLTQDEAKTNKLKSELVLLTQKLNGLYQALGERATREQANATLQQFIQGQLQPRLRELCRELEGPTADCDVAKGEWNNARFVAFLTYEENQSVIEQYAGRHADKGLVQFVEEVRTQYDYYKRHERRHQRFEEFLNKQLTKTSSL